MKFFWPILLVCVILCHTKPEEKKLIKLAKILQLVKRHAQHTDMQRKLEDVTDVSTDDGETNSTANDTDPGNVNNGTKNITMEQFNENMTRRTDNTDAHYKIKRFYGFKQERAASNFYFSMIFSFINELIGRIIRMRLRILYSTTRLRNLQDEPLAQAVTAECTISDSSKVGVNGTGEDIDYGCEAPKIPNMEVSDIKLDTSVPMTIDGKEVKFDDVNFSEEAAEQANNITDATGTNEAGNTNYYRKSSSGLSGGAIAGIVIACVAVLIAAAVAAIMLRKPSPPIDNTTVVDLKQENI